VDLNEYLKQMIQHYQPKVQQGLNMAGMAAQRGLGLIAEDAQRGAEILGDPRMAGIGLGPESAVAGKGLGFLAGALRGIGGSREGLNPLLLAAWKRGEELSAMQKAVRETPDAFGFQTPSAWRKSLSQEDLFSLGMYESTAQKLAHAEMKKQGYLESGQFPSDFEMSRLQAREQFPPGESDSVYALGLDRLKLARKRNEP
jgi:hypothetical protein